MIRQKLDEKTFKDLQKLESIRFTENWQELPNPVGKVVHTDLRPPTMEQQIERVLRRRMLMAVALEETESPEEAIDLEVDDPEDMEPWSPHEIPDEQVKTLKEEEPTFSSNDPEAGGSSHAGPSHGEEDSEEAHPGQDDQNERD